MIFYITKSKWNEEICCQQRLRDLKGMLLLQENKKTGENSVALNIRKATI